MNLKTIAQTKTMLSALLIVGFIGGMNLQSVAADNYSDGIFNFWKKKKKKVEAPAEKETKKKKGNLKEYSEVIKEGAVTKNGVIDIHRVEKDYYFELQDSLLNRDFLIVNKISKISSELNGAGINKGMNYQNLVVRFEVDTLLEKVWVKTYRARNEARKGDAIALSVRDNFIPSVRESFDLACLGKDSVKSYVFKINKVFNGSEKSLNDLFTNIGIPSSPTTSLSHISKVKAFPQNILVKSLLTAKAEGITVSVETTSNLVLLSKEAMKPRFADPRIGFFTVKRNYYSDQQQAVEERKLVNRWRMEPKEEDVEKYLAGELVEPKKQIVYYIDPSTPVQWRQAIKDGITDWQAAFEKAGFKNAIIAKDAPLDDPDFDGDDVRFSMITYAASTQANAMGPSVVDPRSGEIIEADVIWWHNVMTALHSWIRVQTGAIDPKARGNEFTDEHMAHAIRFVSSHEIGHTLGLMHNMGASSAYPVDSLRSASFTERMGGTAPSIMDYARFNYVAQPGDGVKKITPKIGTYDQYAIGWAYRWYNTTTPWDDQTALSNEIRKHENDPLYHYGPQQDNENTVDPSAQSEDLGDNSMKASRYGLKNLKRIVKDIENWTCEEGDSYEKAGKMMMGVISQWYIYANHVVANVGGVYLDHVVKGENKSAYTNVEKSKQKDAVKYLIDEVFNLPKWLTDAEIYKKTYPIKNSPIGSIENAPTTLFRDLQSRIFNSLLAKERFARMIQNEAENGKDAYTQTDLMRDLHRGIFKETIRGRNLDVYTRQVQKCFVDELIIDQNKTLKESRKKTLVDAHDGLYNHMPMLCDYCSHHSLHAEGEKHSTGENQLSERLYYALSMRMSDESSAKRGELLRIRNLLKKRLTWGNDATRFHYEDLLLRIEEALAINTQK